MRDDNSSDHTVYSRSLPLQFHRHLKEREVFSTATMSIVTSVKTHKEFSQFRTVASLKLDLNEARGKENRSRRPRTRPSSLASRGILAKERAA